jgi:hypothetical protein
VIVSDGQAQSLLLPGRSNHEFTIIRQPFGYLTELQCQAAGVVAPPGEAGRLCFISSNFAGCSLVRIVEEELIAVEIIDH